MGQMTSEQTSGTKGNGGDDRWRLDPLDHASLRNGPDTQLLVHAASEKVALFLRIEINRGDHVPR